MRLDEIRWDWIRLDYVILEQIRTDQFGKTPRFRATCGGPLSREYTGSLKPPTLIA
jgi:hypothetical protein